MSLTGASLPSMVAEIDRETTGKRSKEYQERGRRGKREMGSEGEKRWQEGETREKMMLEMGREGKGAGDEGR